MKFFLSVIYLLENINLELDSIIVAENSNCLSKHFFIFSYGYIQHHFNFHLKSPEYKNLSINVSNKKKK